MASSMRPSIADHLTACLAGTSAIPRKNGELVFQAPWESHAFAMAVALCERGLYEWDEFRAFLIQEVQSWEEKHAPGIDYNYYERWVAALEKVLLNKGICQSQEIQDEEQREQQEFAESA